MRCHGETMGTAVREYIADVGHGFPVCYEFAFVFLGQLGVAYHFVAWAHLVVPSGRICLRIG